MLTSTRAILLGGLVVGALDGLDAVVFSGLRGVGPVRVFQAVASGLLGRAAYAGGDATALLGVLLHFFIAFSVVTTYYLASRRLRVLTRHPVWSGLLYGVLVYLVMSLLVVPMSAAALGPKTLAGVVNGLLIHAFGVGLPTALLVRASHPAHSSSSSNILHLLPQRAPRT